jgi:hypothetical protein
MGSSLFLCVHFMHFAQDHLMISKAVTTLLERYVIEFNFQILRNWNLPWR